MDLTSTVAASAVGELAFFRQFLERRIAECPELERHLDGIVDATIKAAAELRKIAWEMESAGAWKRKARGLNLSEY